RSDDAASPGCAVGPPDPPWTSSRITATIRPTTPPPIATGPPADMPRRSEICEGSSRAFRRIRIRRPYPEAPVANRFGPPSGGEHPAPWRSLRRAEVLVGLDPRRSRLHATRQRLAHPVLARDDSRLDRDALDQQRDLR